MVRHLAFPMAHQLLQKGVHCQHGGWLQLAQRDDLQGRIRAGWNRAVQEWAACVEQRVTLQ